MRPGREYLPPDLSLQPGPRRLWKQKHNMVVAADTGHKIHIRASQVQIKDTSIHIPLAKADRADYK